MFGLQILLDSGWHKIQVTTLRLYVQAVLLSTTACWFQCDMKHTTLYRKCPVCSCRRLLKSPTNVLSCLFPGVTADQMVTLEPQLLRNVTDSFMKCSHLSKSDKDW